MVPLPVRRPRSVTVALLVALTCACATPPETTLPPLSLADASSSAYVVVQPGSLGIRGVTSDQSAMYIALDRPPGADLTAHDQAGRQVTYFHSKGILIVDGVHDGVLLRERDRQSFVSRNPVATGTDRFPPERDPAIVAARDARAHAVVAVAFERALSKVDAPKTQTLESERPPFEDPELYQRLADGSQVFRMYFASGGISVVRPDDGLRALEAAAKSASGVEITGYTDSLGSAATNTWISRERARAVARFLEVRGIPRDRIRVAGGGAANAIAENNSPKGRALNRRVEVIIRGNAMNSADAKENR